MAEFENFIGLNPWTALFTLCNLVIVFLMLKKFLFKPVNKMIDDRQQEIDALYADANAAKEKAAFLEADYSRKLAEAKDTSAQILADAAQEANRRTDELIRQARLDADAIRAKAERDVELERRKAFDEVRTDISRIAVDIAEKVVERELEPADEDRLFENFLQEMGETQ
jgi:F-type H+-transporting ATPase subunit b